MALSKKIAVVFLGIVALCRVAHGVPGRGLSVDFGVGLPQIAQVNGEAAFLDWLQVGFGFGMLNSSWVGLPGIKLPEKSVTIKGNPFVFSGDASWTIQSLSPFIRVFPIERNFYVQLTYNMMRVSAIMDSDLVGTALTITDAVRAKATVTQAIPTLSIGHIFSGELYYINLAMGFSVIGTTSVDVEVTGNVPEAIGDSNTASEFQKQKDDIAKAAQDSAGAIRGEVQVLPSIYLGIGFNL